MRILRSSSIEEYSRWYLRRDGRKHPGSNADDSADPVKAMRQNHPGKMRDWFSDATQWSITSLDSMSDLTNLVFLESEWTKREGLVIPNGEKLSPSPPSRRERDVCKLFNAAGGEQA